MTQLTTGQARVVDPVITEVARGYRNETYVGARLFPVVPVGQRGGKIIQFGREAFRLYNTKRAPGGRVARVSFGYGGNPYALEQDALSGQVPFEHLEEAAAVPGIDFASVAVNGVRDIQALRLEFAQATLATTAGNYGASNKVTLSGTSQWSDYSGTSNPLVDIATGIEAIRSQTGMRPNTLVIGPLVWKALKYHPKMLDAALLSSIASVGGLAGGLTLQQAASVLDVRELVVGDAIYFNAADVAADVWGKFAVLAYTIPGSLAAQGMPTYGYTYRLKGYPLVESPYQDNDERSWIYPVIDETAPVIAGADAGYLISAVVA